MTAKDSERNITETFEKDLASIIEKGKDLKGDHRIFYQSIVNRVENNIAVLKDLRQEHSTLRGKLASLTKAKKEKSEKVGLESDLKHTSHEVNLLKQQIDRLKNDKETAVNRQKELEAILENFKKGEQTSHPEEDKIREMKNKLDRANIKAEETMHLMKVYQQIIRLMDKQKAFWTPVVKEKQVELAQKQKDIAELTLVARDSRHSLSVAKTEMARTETQIASERKKRKAILDAKKVESIDMVNRQQYDDDVTSRPSRVQQSMNSQPSMVRNAKKNKAAMEKREELYRKASLQYEAVRDKFGTNDPEAIRKFFADRREQSVTLQKQIEDLKEQCTALQRESEQLRSAIEEADYASSKGIGGNRLLAEGRRILDEKQVELQQQEKEVAATAVNHRNIVAGIKQIADVMALVQNGEGEMSEEPDRLAVWIKERIGDVKERLGQEDVDYLELVNKSVFAQMVQRAEAGFGETGDLQKKQGKKADLRKAAKDTRADVTNRVLDRATIKLQSQRTVQQAQNSQKKKP